MDITQYLAEEGITERLTLEGVDKLKKVVGPEYVAELEKNEGMLGTDPTTAVKAHYGILARYGVLNSMHGLLFEEIRVHAPAVANKLKGYERVLDAGCGDALRLVYYAQECSESRFLGIDHGLESIVLAEQRIQKRQLKNVGVNVRAIADVERLNETFDCITATNVLHESFAYSFDHYGGGWNQDIASGLVCLSRVLRTGGRLLFTLHFGDNASKEYMMGREINPGLKDAGLEVEEQTDVLFNHFDDKTINGLWVCKKK